MLLTCRAPPSTAFDDSSLTIRTYLITICQIALFCGSENSMNVGLETGKKAILSAVQPSTRIWAVSMPAIGRRRSRSLSLGPFGLKSCTFQDEALNRLFRDGLAPPARRQGFRKRTRVQSIVLKCRHRCVRRPERQISLAYRAVLQSRSRGVS